MRAILRLWAVPTCVIGVLLAACSSASSGPDTTHSSEEAGATHAYEDAGLPVRQNEAGLGVSTGSLGDSAWEASQSDGVADGAAPGCSDACAKAVLCGMVKSSAGCVCEGKAGSMECATCWTTHTCDELNNYACYGACN
jgi:hypothetical protein